MSVAILCEGKSDKEFLELLLDNLSIEKDSCVFYILGNKSNFFKKDNTKYTELLEDIELEKITKTLFVIDADNIENDSNYGGYDNTERELQNIIKELGLNNCDIFIMCDPQTRIGYLESLILSTISPEQKQCIDDFLSCSEFKSKDNHKAILHQIYKQAYPQYPYDFSHSNFEILKQKLQDLFNE